MKNQTNVEFKLNQVAPNSKKLVRIIYKNIFFRIKVRSLCYTLIITVK